MHSGYFYKLKNSWTLPMYQLPRWVAGNAYLDLFDVIPTPSTGLLGTVGAYDLPSDDKIPTSWALTSITPASTGTVSIFQRIFEALVAERSYLRPGAISQQYSRSLFFDESDPEFAWVVKAPFDNIDKVELLASDGSRTEVTQARSYYELFWSADRRWFYENGLLILYGLAFLEQDALSAGGWQYISSLEKWSSGGVLFWEHPETRSWIPKHPVDIRQDGFLNLYYDDTIRLRSHVISAAQALSGVHVYINDQIYLAELVNLWTSTDEKGLWENLYRLPRESTADFGRAVLLCQWFGRQTKTGLRDHLSAALRQGVLVNVSPSASGFDLPNYATGYSIHGFSRVNYKQEPIVYDVDSLEYYRSIYNNPSFGIAIYQGRVVTHTAVSGSVWSIDAHINTNRAIAPLFYWGIQYWSETGSSVVFSDDMPQGGSDLTVYFPSNVNVTDPDNTILRKSFRKISSIYRWQHDSDSAEQSKGLATFN